MLIKDRQKTIPYLIFISPAVLLYLLIMVFPVGMTFLLSFTEWEGYGPLEFIGIDNYIRMFSDPVFWWGLRNNFLIVFVSVFGQIPLGLILAYMLHRNMVRYAKFFQAVIFLPITISVIIIALLWSRIFSPVGLYTSIVRHITGNPQYLIKIFTSEHFAILPILFVILWQYVSLYMVIFISNMQRIPNSIIESALVDGATEGKIFLKIIVPQLVGVIFVNCVLAISGSFKSFELIFVMTAGGPTHFTEVVGMYMYNHTFIYHNYGFGAAISIVMVLFCLITIILVRGIMKRYHDHS